MKIIYFISFIAVLNFFSACNLFIQNQTPEILTAEYKLKSYNDTERGFEVFLVIKNIRPEHKIKSIVLKNHRFDGIKSHEMMKNQVFIDEFLILNSSIIQNFESPMTDKRNDGIIFDIEGEEHYLEIDFKLNN